MNQSTERFNCVFPNYPEEIKLSNARRKKYWKAGQKLTDALQKKFDESKVVYKQHKSGDILLWDKETNEFILKNPKAVGTPRIEKINGQIVWQSGGGNEWKIRKLKDYLSEWFRPGIARRLPEQIFTPSPDIFIHFEYIFFFPFQERHPETYQDYLNHAYIRSKVFEDTLVDMGVIPDDSPRYLRGGYCRYVNVPSEEDRRLEVKIHFCKNNQRIS